MDNERAADPGNGHDDAATVVVGEHRAAVVEVMARIAAGERSAVWELHALAERTLAGIVRAEARRIDFWLSEDDLLDLTLDAAVELGKLAPAWQPDGALPWVWARRRITALVQAHIGTFTRPLDDAHHEIEGPEPIRPIDDPRAALRSLAARHPSARQLDTQLGRVTERDAEIWLLMQMERAAGNRSPAVTVAAIHDMRPDAVRKVFQRVGERISDVA